MKTTLNTNTNTLLDFDTWMDINEDRLMDILEQNGATNEMDFDLEKELSILYVAYCDSFIDKNIL